MSIIIKDLDESIISFMDLPEIVILMQCNKNYYSKIKDMQLIKQWNIMKRFIGEIDDLFIEACKQNFIIYAQSLIARYPHINIHKYNDDDDIYNAFQTSCIQGHLELAKWLKDLGETIRYSKVNIHLHDDFVFRVVCSKGQIDIAKWLIDLGENHCYDKINIHFQNEYCFEKACKEGQIKIAKWLIDLGENHGYGKINIHDGDDYIFKTCCNYHQIDIAKWLIDLGENHGYGKFDQYIIDKYIK